MRPSTVRVALAAVVLTAATLHLVWLGEAPINISTDEARFAIQAHALATTGLDIHGNRLPLFFLITNPLIPNHSSVAWWQPELFYLMAGVFQVAPLSDWSARLPVAALAVLNVWLIHAVARALFANAWYAVLAAALLALTPAHFIMGRLAADYFCPLSFALGWLWCLLRCRTTESAWIAGATGLVLGIGLYSYITSWVVMPFYLAITLVTFRRFGKAFRSYVALVTGFALPCLPLVAWLWAHPEMPRDVFSNYKVAADFRIVERVSLYWDYLNPSYLFFAGGSNLMWSTRQAGLFPLAVAVLLPCGLWAIGRRGTPIVRVVLAIGFFLAAVPIVVALPEAPDSASARHLLAVPFGVLISIAGLEWLWTDRGRVGRLAATLLILAVPLQFVGFARDYFTDYQIRSAIWSDSMNSRGVATSLVSADASATAPAVYLTEDDLGEDKVVKLRFHLLVMQRSDLWERTRYVPRGRSVPEGAATGSLLVVLPGNPGLDAWLGDGWSRAAVVNDVTGEPAATILRRR